MRGSSHTLFLWRGSNLDIMPLTPDEVSALHVDMLHRIQRNPKIIQDPSFIGMMRLVLTISTNAIKYTVPVVESMPVIAEPPKPTETVDSLLFELLNRLDEEIQPQLLQRLLDLSLEKGLIQQAPDPSLPELNTQIAALNHEIDLSRLALAEMEQDFQARLSDLSNVNHELKLNISVLECQLVTQQEKYDNACSAHSGEKVAKEQECVAYKQKIKTLEDEVAAGNAKLVSIIEQVVKSFEWVGISKKYETKSGSPYPCCFRCGGLKPDGLTPQSYVDHTSTCEFIYLKKSLKTLKGTTP